MLTLVRRTLPSSTKLTAEDGNITVVAGQSLKIETTPGGVELLNDVCPTGKTWKVAISVSIDEE